jgi:SRSO17 transposase
MKNGQMSVFVAYAGKLGQALLDRELYLLDERTNARERYRAAGIPETGGFATKPQLVQRMLAPSISAGVPSRWVTGDSVHGSARRLRMWLEERPQA